MLIAGGGVFGVTIAHALTRRGARVTLVDPGPLGENASGVAAGMLAPAFETLLDPVSPSFAVLREARDLWTDLARLTGVTLDRTGALALANPARIDAWCQAAEKENIRVEPISTSSAIGMAPWLETSQTALWSPEDWRLEARVSLESIWSKAADLGASWLTGSVMAHEPGRGLLADGRTVECDALVIATGNSRVLEGHAPELGNIAPIKGHILRFPRLRLNGPVIRVDGAYICPSANGAVVGSTMEAGRDDLAVDPLKTEMLRQSAAAASPEFLTASFMARAGVRAATPDGLPMVGRAGTDGIWLAVGARRNGWLLAPLVARVLADQLTGEARSCASNAFDPARFRPLA